MNSPYEDFLTARKRLTASPKVLIEPFEWAGAKVGQCWQNVSRLVDGFGGRHVYGWVLSEFGPIVVPSREMRPLYARWLNHVVWRDNNDQLWEATPSYCTINCATNWQSTIFIVDEAAQFEVASFETCCPQPSIYFAMRPEGEWFSDCLCHAERAPLEAQASWLERAHIALREAGSEPTNWRVNRVGDRLRGISAMVLQADPAPPPTQGLT